MPRGSRNEYGLLRSQIQYIKRIGLKLNRYEIRVKNAKRATKARMAQKREFDGLSEETISMINMLRAIL